MRKSVRPGHKEKGKEKARIGRVKVGDMEEDGTKALGTKEEDNLGKEKARVTKEE